MADVPVGAVPAPTAEAPKVSPVVAAQQAKAAKLATVNAGLKKLMSEEATAPVEAPVEKPAEPEKVADATEKPAEEAPVEKPADKVEAKPDEVADDKPDAKTSKALAAIDKQAKKFRDEQAADRAALALERAELAKLKADITGKASSMDELRALAKRDPISVLEKLGIESEDEWEVVGRSAFPRTKAGKADPRSKPIADQTAKERALMARAEAAERKSDEALEMIKGYAAAQQTQQFVAQWQAEAVKAIPEAPSLIGKLHAKSPAKAKAALLEIGKRLERENDNETPAHADVIAAYEKERRAELEEAGVDVDAMLKPTVPASTVKAAPSKTLDVASPSNGTRPINGNPTKEQRIAAVNSGLKKLWDEQPS